MTKEKFGLIPQLELIVKNHEEKSPLEEKEKRSWRRHHLMRKKHKARRIYKHDSNGTLANHLASCSCALCGNPRRHFGHMTIQEKRAIDKFLVEMTDALASKSLT